MDASWPAKNLYYNTGKTQLLVLLGFFLECRAFCNGFGRQLVLSKQGELDME